MIIDLFLPFCPLQLHFVSAVGPRLSCLADWPNGAMMHHWLHQSSWDWLHSELKGTPMPTTIHNTSSESPYYRASLKRISIAFPFNDKLNTFLC